MVWNKKKRFSLFRFLFRLICFALLAVCAINLWMLLKTNPYVHTEETAIQLSDVDCILVLGCGVRGDTPSPLLEDRLKRGIALFQLGTSPKILMSGDHGREQYDEVNVMKQYAVDHGIAEVDIFMDHAGFSTYESMYRAKEIFGIDKMIIVTQKYHLTRALYIARSMGIEAYGVASDYQQFSGQFYRNVREIAARVKDFFYVLIKPDPTYLGPSIPISGDGTATNG